MSTSRFINIATAFHLAGLYAVFPFQFDEAPQLKTAFKALADQVRPSHVHDHQSLKFNDLVCVLFDQFSQYESGNEEISKFISGLGMMACKDKFKGFSAPAGEALDRILKRYVASLAETREEDINPEDGVEILFWLSKLAELRLLPLLKTSDDHDHPWINAILAGVPEDGSEIVIMKTISALGRLAAHGRKPLLTDRGRNRLARLLQMHLLGPLSVQPPENYSEFLHALGWIFVSKVIPPQYIVAHESLYRKHFLRVMAGTHGIKQTMDSSKILFFIEAFQKICAGHLSSTDLDMSQSFAQEYIEEQFQFFEIVKNLQEGTLRARQQREMNGRSARFKPFDQS